MWLVQGDPAGMWSNRVELGPSVTTHYLYLFEVHAYVHPFSARGVLVTCVRSHLLDLSILSKHRKIIPLSFPLSLTDKLPSVLCCSGIFLPEPGLCGD